MFSFGIPKTILKGVRHKDNGWGELLTVSLAFVGARTQSRRYRAVPSGVCPGGGGGVAPGEDIDLTWTPVVVSVCGGAVVVVGGHQTHTHTRAHSGWGIISTDTWTDGPEDWGIKATLVKSWSLAHCCC